MKRLALSAALLAVLAIGAIAYAQTMHGGRGRLGPGTMMHGGWPATPMWSRGQGPGNGPIPRHHFAMMSGIPAPYASMTNPLPHTQATLDRGAQVYAADCAACHGQQGLGDGPAGASLSPRPGNLAWLSDMPMGQWDPFIYWTVAEGGSQFGTAMPTFEGTLSKDQIWAVTAYIQAHLPQKAK